MDKNTILAIILCRGHHRRHEHPNHLFGPTTVEPASDPDGGLCK